MNSSNKDTDFLYDKIRHRFIGLDTEYTLANNETQRRIYLDSTATTLMMETAYEVLERFYHHYGNTHSLLHFDAKIATREYHWAHHRILDFIRADADIYTSFFTGSGTTAGINRLARVFRDIRPDKNIAIISIMEHHSNDLPHRKHMAEVLHTPVTEINGNMGCISLESLEQLLQENEGQVNYVALTGVSNVTGIINPINEAAELAHKYGALMLVDGAQMLAHMPVQMMVPENPAQNIDALVFSGHKTYVPGSPGVVITRKDLLSQIEPEEVGGGMVQDVYMDRYEPKDFFPDREEAGTPNIPGAIALAAAIDVLDRIGIQFLQEEEERLIQLALEGMINNPDIHIYGETDPDICRRLASISFNIKGMDHGLVAAILNDYFGIAVRNECFCAHPYVKEMIMDDLLEATEDIPLEKFEEVYHLKRGMVRASFALYTTEEDIEKLIQALQHIIANKEFYRSQYAIVEGNYVHKTFRLNNNQRFTVLNTLEELLS
ncbi:MAG: aminotransferase class V-fold PLP-dependent enzyme [Fidelibacterota bacterium]